MEKHSRINREVEKTLSALDGIKKAQTDELFYERLSKKIDSRERKTTSFLFLVKEPSYSLVGFFLILIIALNIISLAKYRNDLNEQWEEYGNQQTQVEEIGLSIPILYTNSENIK